jgi:hypothetical protein
VRQLGFFIDSYVDSAAKPLCDHSLKECDDCTPSVLPSTFSFASQRVTDTIRDSDW